MANPSRRGRKAAPRDEEKKPVKRTVALIGEGGLLLGFRAVVEADWVETSAQVPVPEGCDLAPRHYRWTGETFAPLVKRPRGGDQDAVAIALGFKALERLTDPDRGGPFALPAETAAWCDKILERFRHTLSAFDEAHKDSR